jgi:hypothetical protein
MDHTKKTVNAQQFIKYLRYIACADWTNICNISVHIGRQRYSA